MKILRGFSLCLLVMCTNICWSDISPSTGLSKGHISLYEYYVSQELVGGYYHHHCLFAEISSFEKPHAIFIYEQRKGGFEVVYRTYSDNIKSKMNSYLISKDLDPLSSKPQMMYFLENETSVLTVTKGISIFDAENLIEKFSNLDVSFQEDLFLDGSSLYFSTYKNPGFVTGRPYLFGANNLGEVRSKLFEYVDVQ